jgi:hypothetical protein
MGSQARAAAGGGDRGEALTITLLILTAFAVLTGACNYNGSQNEDCSLKVETSIGQESLQTAIDAGIAHPLIKT